VIRSYIHGRRNKVVVERYGYGMQDLMQQGGELRWVAWWVPKIVRITGQRTLQMLVVTGFSLTLAACDKCSMPVRRHDTAPTPQSCHDDTPAQQ
jgi:hypothetical protein